MAEKKPKIGAGHFAAMGRQGLSELRAALYTDSNVAQPPGYGIAGTRTPQEVVAEKQGDTREPDESRSSLADKIKEAEKEDERSDARGREREDRAIERD